VVGGPFDYRPLRSAGAASKGEHLDRIDDADEQRYEDEIQAFESGASEAEERTETTSDREDES